MPPTSVPGACLCGEVEFSVELPTEICVHCHCTMCQRAHGAAFVTWFVVPTAQLTIERGADSLATYESSSHAVRKFCNKCGSSLFCESEHRAGHTDIVLANMKQPIDHAPQLHIYHDNRVSWTEAKDELPRLGGETGMEPTQEKPRTQQETS